jgi:hypothetical protein|tara:strand:+ start:4416 stop:4658 length:243 start_codon:yes stop_codon:yes gene_type:complete
MAKKIAVIDFPLGENVTSHFVGNGAEGQGGLVTKIEENGFEADLINYKTLSSNPINPGDYAAVFFCIRMDTHKRPRYTRT